VENIETELFTKRYRYQPVVLPHGLDSLLKQGVVTARGNPGSIERRSQPKYAVQTANRLILIKNLINLSKIWVWNPESEMRKKPIPDPGPKGEKGTGSRIHNTDCG
jgi:hypothetical protein